MSIEITREGLIKHGVAVLQSIGSHHICHVCIKSGNSCCKGCDFLQEGVGCQKRNTSCTAWLCGLQKFYLKEIGLLKEWEHMWEQVPGQCFRRDETPHTVKIDSLIKIEKYDDKAAKLVAKKLESFAEEGGNIGKLETKLALDFEVKKMEKIHPLYRDK
ncbi:DNA mismatch repair protein [Metabacillus fastidiosus]|uniref:DNA mismatch repair protein n=1 Tax=Metabacillus fastidiosus TaxID=1458 RepID=UPI003D287613